jgi:hypothetical protein
MSKDQRSMNVFHNQVQAVIASFFSNTVELEWQLYAETPMAKTFTPKTDFSPKIQDFSSNFCFGFKV